MIILDRDVDDLGYRTKLAALVISLGAELRRRCWLFILLGVEEVRLCLASWVEVTVPFLWEQGMLVGISEQRFIKLIHLMQRNGKILKSVILLPNRRLLHLKIA